LLFHMGIEHAYGRRTPDVYAAYRQLCDALPIALRTPNRVFLSHSLPDAARNGPFDPLMLEREEVLDDEWHPGGSLYALLWGRDTTPDNVHAFLRKVDADLFISGHIPCERGYDTPNDQQLILDSMGSPAAYCLFPANRPLSFQELLSG